MTELTPYPPAQLRSSRLSALAGILSVVLFWASLRWAHHWGAQTDALAAGFAFTTLTALFLSSRLLWHLEGSTRLAKIGLTGALFSIGAAAVIGLLQLNGIDAAGACGGG